MDGTTTPSFLEAIKKGDFDQVFRIFLERYSVFVKVLTRNTLLNSDARLMQDLDDFAAQVATDVACKLIEAYDPERRKYTGGFRAWLTTVAPRLLIDHLRTLRASDKGFGGDSRLFDTIPDANSAEVDVLDTITKEHDRWAQLQAIDFAFKELISEFLDRNDQLRAGVLMDLGLDGLFRHGNSTTDVEPASSPSSLHGDILRRHDITPPRLSRFKAEFRDAIVERARRAVDTTD